MSGTEYPDGGFAFPEGEMQHQTPHGYERQPGMTLRDYFAGQALTNKDCCNGAASENNLKKWFGERVGITPCEIAARQAYEMADAMLEARGS